MSIHSAVEQQNHIESNSHVNNPNPSMQAHSANIQKPPINSYHQQWVAAYIDGQYYLTDPESMRRLKNIQNQIEHQRSRLAKLENDGSEYNHSFLSLQEERVEMDSNRSLCITEFNENKNLMKEGMVKEELEKEEDRYREKIRKMEKERSQMKRKMTSRESSKDKSYHKSRIQQSIRDNSEVNNNQCEIKIMKPSSVKNSNKGQNPSSSQIPKIEGSRTQGLQYSELKTRKPRQDYKQLKSHKESSHLENIQDDSKGRQRSRVSKVNTDQVNQIGPTGFIPGVNSEAQQKSLKLAKPRSEFQAEPDSPNEQLASIKSKARQRSIIEQASAKQSTMNQQYLAESQIRKQPSVKQSSHKEQSHKYNNIILFDEKKSRKSHSKNSRVSRRSDVPKIDQSKADHVEQAEIKIKKSLGEDKSSKSQKQSQLSSVKGSTKEKQMKDQSCQYSRATNVVKQSRASQSVGPNESSMQQSSSFNNMTNNELIEEAPLENSQHQVSAFKKKRQGSVKDNQSEKKSKSFIIHSRNGSVKERNQSVNRSKFSQRKSLNKDPAGPSQHSDSVSKEELAKLHEHIALLRQKLKKVQERQDNMEKAQITMSKIKSNDGNESHDVNSSPPESPLVRLSNMNFGLRPQPRLQLESSILQVDTRADDRKREEKQKDADEKVKLKEQISRLKKVIRDMQIEKIKSIDHDNQLGGSVAFHNKASKQFSQKDSLHSFEGIPTQRKFWGKSRVEQAGKIIKNAQPISPRKRSQHIKFYGNMQDEVVVQPEDLPFESGKKTTSKFISQAKKVSLIERLHDKERDFHQFMESSRVLAQSNHRGQGLEYGHDSPSASFQHFSKISVSDSSHPEPVNKINYSRLVEQFKKPNPEEEEVLPEITLRDLKVEQLPATPTPEMNQQELLTLAKKVYQVFGVDVDNEDKQLSVKKYKNCVVFSITTNPSECILWHFSGKFYMGGWKTGQPGQGEKQGQGLQIIPEKYVYKGQFLNGKKNGTGILKLANGNIYDGQWIEGLKNGRGVYLDAATRVVYSGQWNQGKKDGQGYLKLSEKEYYYGTFNKSVKEGFGVEVFVNGDKYKGQYNNGKFNGKGKYTWANDSCYEGQFVEGVRQGQGSWRSAKNNGDIYIGTYEGDKKNGYGRYVWANGCIYEGGFANDVKHGKGRLTYQDGKEVKGTWSEGNLIKTDEKQPIQHEDQPLRKSFKTNAFGVTGLSNRKFVQ